MTTLFCNCFNRRSVAQTPVSVKNTTNDASAVHISSSAQMFELPLRRRPGLRRCSSVPIVPLSSSYYSNKRAKMLLLSNAPRFPIEHCFWKVPRLRPFVLPVTATCRWRLVEHCWNDVDGGKKKYWEENLRQWHCLPQISHESTWEKI
jgi:hypothetical protein